MDAHPRVTDEKPGIVAYIASWIVAVSIFGLLVLVAFLAIRQ